jgi:hypothetical protein
MADPNSTNGGILLYIGIAVAIGAVIAAGAYFGS